MSRRKTYAAAAGAVVVVLLLVIAGLRLWPIEATGPSCSSGLAGRCSSQQPLVDIILPAIGSSGNSTNSNRVVNVTVGSSETLEVDIYPTVAMNLTMSFSSYPLSYASSSSGNISEIPMATFEPRLLDIAANGHGITEMRLMIASGVRPGTYDAVITATSLSNSSLTWGLFFELSCIGSNA